MFAMKKLVTVLGLSAVAMASQAAGTLIYCSEGSPEGFDTAQYTGATPSTPPVMPCSTD